VTPLCTLRPAALALAALALLATATVPAAAETETHRDARRDVVKSYSEDELENARSNRTADVYRLDTTYDARRLYLTAYVRRVGDDISLAPTIQTPDETFYGDFSWREGEGKDLELREAETFDEVCDDAVHGRVDRSTDTATFWVPWRCIGRPDWVRTGTIVWSFARNGHEVVFADEALRKKGYSPGEWAIVGDEVAYG
jgi:hypothetical protein